MEDVLEKARKHEEWRARSCVNLIPSENATSPWVQELLASDMGRRYTLPIDQKVHDSYVENAYRGTRYIDEVESEGERLAKKLYGARYACLKPLSGHLSALISLLATCRKGDRIMFIGSMHGGYDGYMQDYMPDFLGLNAEPLPFDENAWNIDLGRSVRKIISRKPRAVIVGASFLLFPYNLKALRKACNEAGSVLMYDASHVLGLMPRNFQDALGNGVDILYGSTHKSLFGPQGGIIMTRDQELHESFLKNIVWRTMDNAHWNRIAALARALEEYDRFGDEYGAQVVRNAKRLAKALDSKGIPIRFRDLGYTKSHMFLLDAKGLGSRHKLDFDSFARRLEESNIVTDAVGRMGLCEMTRLGATEEDMEALADLVLKALKKNVKSEVRELRDRLRLSYV